MRRLVLAALALLIVARSLSAGAEPRRIVLSLLPLDDQKETVTSEGDSVIISRPMLGVFVASVADCPPDVLIHQCHSRWPIAVLTTLDGMKRFAGALPRGSSIYWNPGCLGPFPEWHPLSDPGAEKVFKEFAEDHGLIYTRIAAG